MMVMLFVQWNGTSPIKMGCKHQDCQGSCQAAKADLEHCSHGLRQTQLVERPLQLLH